MIIKEIFNICRDYIAEEIKTISSLEKNKRLGYIWDYHKWKIISFTALVCVCLGSVRHFMFYNQQIVYEIAVVNQETDLERDEKNEKLLCKFLNINPKKEYVRIDSAYQIPFGDKAQDRSDYTDYERFFMKLSNKEIDCAVMPEKFVKYCIEIEPVFYDLSEFSVSCEDEKIFRYNGSEYGIYLSVSDYGQGRSVMCFPNNGKHKQNTELIIRYICGG